MKRLLAALSLIAVMCAVSVGLLLCFEERAEAMPINCDFFDNSTSTYWPGYGMICCGYGPGCYDCY